jgi:hypothetical protein
MSDSMRLIELFNDAFNKLLLSIVISKLINFYFSVQLIFSSSKKKLNLRKNCSLISTKATQVLFNNTKLCNFLWNLMYFIFQLIQEIRKLFCKKFFQNWFKSFCFWHIFWLQNYLKVFRCKWLLRIDKKVWLRASFVMLRWFNQKHKRIELTLYKVFNKLYARLYINN